MKARLPENINSKATERENRKYEADLTSVAVFVPMLTFSDDLIVDFQKKNWGQA